ncbi:biopolymer transporter ExbD [bacterium]|nr:biopolymer transporter ExbD [bacterium]
MRFKRRLTISKGFLDMTPLIDVVLLLLIFFMLSSSFVFNPGVKVDLPEYTSSESLDKSDLVVTITREGLYLYNDNSILLRELENKFRQAASENPNARLIIKSANEVPHGIVVKVMVMAKEAGIKNQAFATRPKED